MPYCGGGSVCVACLMEWGGGGLGSFDLAKGVEDCIGCYKVFII